MIFSERGAMAACPSASDLPEHLIRRILLATDHADLLTHVSVCARVCADWRQAVRTSAAHSGGRGLPWTGRTRSPRCSRRMQQGGQSGRGC